MKCSFTVQTTIARPTKTVFEALVNPKSLNRYFVDRASGPLDPGSKVVWHWTQWGDYPVEVDEVVPDSRISLRINSKAWRKSEVSDYDVRVDFDLASLKPDLTLLKISETGWWDDDEGIKASYENCSGWQHMADCAKAWLEHGIDLRSHPAPAEGASDAIRS